MDVTGTAGHGALSTELRPEADTPDVDPAFARPIVEFFTTEPAASPVGVEALTIISYGYVFYAWGMVLTNAFNGAGDTWTPTLINLGCFWLLEIPLAWFLAEHTGAGPRGVFWAITTAFSMVAVVSAVLFRRGKWKLKRV